MDMRIPLACVLLAGGMLGLAMPSITEAGRDAPDEAGLTAADSADKPTLANLTDRPGPAWHEEVLLEREMDGHFYADVNVDGVPMRMLVDTGASVIALTGEDASAMGLFWDDSEIVPVAQGASGTVYGVHTELRRVTIGNFEATDVQAMIIPEGLGISLLGQSFLSTVNSVEIADDRMILAS